MSIEDTAWILLRLVYAWMFLSPLPVLLKNWPGTVSNTGLLFCWHTEWFARASIALMIFGALSILFGIYARLGGLGLMLFSLGGAVVHTRLGKTALNLNLSSTASPPDKAMAEQLKTLAATGHTTSAHKNYVLAAVGCFIFLQGAGSWILIRL